MAHPIDLTKIPLEQFANPVAAAAVASLNATILMDEDSLSPRQVELASRARTRLDQSTI